MTWTRSETEKNSFFNNSEIASQRVLEIDPKLIGNEGDYACTANNKFGKSVLTFRLFREESTNEFHFYMRSLSSVPMIQIEEPNFELPILDYNLLETRTLNNYRLSNDIVVANIFRPLLLRCPPNLSLDASLTSVLPVKWFKSGKKLDYSLVAPSGNLFISEVQNEDFGKYTCKADNKFYEINLEQIGIDS